MVNKTVKKICAVCLTTAMLLSSVIPVAAAEIEPRISKNSSWSFYVPNATVWTALTEQKPKDNATKVYVYWATSGGISYLNAKIYGADKDGRNQKECGGSNGGPHPYRLPGLGKYSLTNYVREHGYDFAVVKVQGIGAASNISGQWSPDSVVTYTVIN